MTSKAIVHRGTHRVYGELVRSLYMTSKSLADRFAAAYGARMIQTTPSPAIYRVDFPALGA